MFIFISKKNLKELECIMSKFLDDFHALLDKVTSTQNDAAAIKELQDLLTANTAADAENKATDDEQTQAILELAAKLGEAPVTPES